MAKAKIPQYPRKSPLALGNGELYPDALTRAIKENEHARKAGKNQDFPLVLAKLLEDAFQCGVVVTDQASGSVTKISKDPDRKLMHTARARAITAMSSHATTRRDDDQVYEYMVEAGQRAYRDGSELSRRGKHSYASLFSFEPIPAWRIVPPRYAGEMFDICRVYENAAKLGINVYFQDAEFAPGSYHVAPIAGSVSKEDAQSISSGSITLAGVNALRRAGVLQLNNWNDPVVIPTPIIEAFCEQKAFYNRQEEEYTESETLAVEKLRASIDRDENGFFCFPAQHRPMRRFAAPDPYWCKTPISPIDVFGNSFGWQFSNTGQAKFEDGALWVDIKARDYQYRPSSYARGAELVLHMLSLEGVDLSPNERNRFWMPSNLGIGSDAFRLAGTEVDILLQQIDYRKKDETIYGWEASQGVSAVEIRTPEGTQHQRIFLLAEIQNKDDMLSVAARLQASLDRAWDVAPENSPESPLP